MTQLINAPAQIVVDPREPLHRLSMLLDPGTLEPMHDADDSNVRTVRGRVHGNPVIAYCTDGSRKGGSIGMAGCLRIAAAIDTAVRDGCPVIGLWHSGGAQLAGGVESMDGIGRFFVSMVRASGRIPQISVILGPAAGGAAYGAALTDVVVMAPAGRMFVTGPEIVRAVTGEQIDMAGLGGADAHGRKSGVVHVTADSEPDAYLRTRRLTSLLARPGVLDPGLLRTPVDLASLLPEQPRRAYDVRPLVRRIVDGPPGTSSGISSGTSSGTSSGLEYAGFEELQAGWARNVVIGLGRLGGRTVGVVANNPLRKGGCLDSLSAEKSARFVRMCDALGVPLVVVVDVPGYLPGVDQEWGGVIRRGAKLLHAFAEASVPRVTLVVRKSYGGAYIAMNSKALGATSVLAWPNAEVAVMGAEAAVNVLYRKELAAATETERPALHRRLAEEHALVSGGIDRGMALGVVDRVIDPSNTRWELGVSLAAAPAGRGHHANIPL